MEKRESPDEKPKTGETQPELNKSFSMLFDQGKPQTVNRDFGKPLIAGKPPISFGSRAPSTLYP